MRHQFQHDVTDPYRNAIEELTPEQVVATLGAAIDAFLARADPFADVRRT